MNNGKIRRKSFQRSAAVLGIMMLFAHSVALACPVCYGDKESAEVEGARWAIMFLLGVTGTVLSGVIAFVVHMRRRSRLIQNESSI